MIAFSSFSIALLIIWVAHSIGRGLDIVEQDLNSETFSVPAGSLKEHINDARGSGPLETFAQGNRRAAGIAGCRSAVAFEQSDVDLDTARSPSPTWRAGDLIPQNYETPRAFRSRLKSLLSIGKVKPAPGPRAA